MQYFIVGDLHGHAEELEALLKLAGFRESAGAYRKAGTTALFVGDLIDRGPGNARVLQIVRSMIDSGHGRAVMGNHEINALHFGTVDERGQPLRSHNDKHTGQHKAFLAEFPLASARHQEALRWMAGLPLWLDLGHIRVIHAFWNQDDVNRLSRWTTPAGVLTEEGVHVTGTRGHDAYNCVERLLKGPEVKLEAPEYFKDKEGHLRKDARVRWWSTQSRRPHCLLVPPPSNTHVQDVYFDIKSYAYPPDAVPLFVGHYWLTQQDLETPNVACLDLSVAKSGGRLAGYCWDGETVLAQARFLTVERGPNASILD